ncbi:hypothetical protein PHMEG_00018471 [Phytophthora megakarya]|uniref:Uncharacterized protein n=1 Tax=Phytophthora megakarya TaxID=4795 RepID=A0A225VTZ2_9STRA|nr:hypothetical protein PHMEG_00018471 [Phytophthora megakarya]
MWYMQGHVGRCEAAYHLTFIFSTDAMDNHGKMQFGSANFCTTVSPSRIPESFERLIYLYTHQFVVALRCLRVTINWLVLDSANVMLRREYKKLQRICEALELFNALATMNRRAFLHLLVEFVVVADHFDDIFTPDLIFVSPVWKCYVVGRLDSEEVVTTWGELFGCGEDPMEYSEEFHVAMGKLEIMKEETMDVLQDFIGQQTAVEWCDPTVVIEWTAEHVAGCTDERSSSDLNKQSSFTSARRDL